VTSTEDLRVPAELLRGPGEPLPPAPFAPVVVLTREEVFDALETCAAAEAALCAAGRWSEAAWASSLFELLEDRVTTPPSPATGAQTLAVFSAPSPASVAGSNSSDRELTQ